MRAALNKLFLYTQALPARLRHRGLLPALALLALTGAGAWHDLALLTSHPVAAGVDGYYYVKQIEHLLTRGKLYYPSNTPLVLYAMSGLALVTGSAIPAVKVGVVVLHLLLGLGVFTLVESLTGRAWLGVLGASMTAVSGLRLYMLAEFVNNLGAITLLVWAACFAVRASQTRRAFWLCLCGACLLGALFSHRSTAAILFAIAASALLTRGLMSPEAGGFKKTALCLLVLIVWCAPGAVALTQSFVELPPIVRDTFTAIPRWPLRSEILPEALIVLAASPFCLFMAARTPTERREGIARLAFGSVALLGLLFTLNPFFNPAHGWTGAAGRFKGLLYIQAAILVPGLVWLLSRGRSLLVPYVAVLVVPLMALSFMSPLPHGLQPGYLSEREELIRQLAAQRDRLGADALVVAPHGDQFVVTYALDVPSQQRPPESARGLRVYWLLFGVEPDALTPGAIVLTKREGFATALVEDGELRQRLATTGGRESAALFAANRHLRNAYSSPGGGGTPGGF